MTLRTIVVIEDDPVLRHQTAELLEAAGLDVMGFEDGERALAYIAENRKTVAGVFTDVRLATETDGFEVAHRVMETFPGMVVIVTSGQYAEHPAELDERIRFLAKPWLPLDVLNAIIDSVQEE